MSFWKSSEATCPPAKPSNELKSFKTLKDFSSELVPKLLDQNHIVMIDLDCLRNGFLSPFQWQNQESTAWDGQNVKLPNAQSKGLSSRWEAIQSALSKLKRSVSAKDIKGAIGAYNSHHMGRWSFNVLEEYSKKVHKHENIMSSVIPKMAKLALELPDLFKRPIPLLRQGRSMSVTLSQQQISCLLAHAFFCTFPHRNDTSPTGEYSNYPSINFSSLFGGDHPETKTEKLKAIFHYFNTVTSEDSRQGTKPDGLVTFERISIPHSQLPQWRSRPETMKELYISADGSIDKEGTGMLQVDFANSLVGGGVLKSGSVQEEIQFLMSPELIVARLFTERLGDNECLRITGPQVYNQISGYSYNISWAGPQYDQTERDDWKRRYRQIVTLDAVDYKRSPREQYTKGSITRELNKAYVGFSGNPKTAVATGNWGCGAFKGDAKLKALIQLMAAAVCERDLAFFTFRNQEQVSDVKRMHQLLNSKRVSVGQLYTLLEEYSDRCSHGYFHKDVFTFLHERIAHKISSM